MPKIEIENYKTNVPAGVSNFEVRPQDVGFNAGANLEVIGKAQVKQDEREAVNYAVGQFSDFQLNEMQELQKAKETGDPNFTQNYLMGYDSRLGNYLKDAPNETAGGLLQKRASDWKDVIAGKAIEFEVTQRQAEALKNLDVAADNYQKIVRTDPSQLPVVQRQVNGDIDAMVAMGRITPIEGESRKRRNEKLLASNAVYPQLQSGNVEDVDNMVAELKAGTWDSIYQDDPKQKTQDIKFGEDRSAAIKERAVKLEAVRKDLGRPLNLTMKLVDDNITLEDINGMEQEKQITPEQGNTLRTALSRSDIDPKVGDISTQNTAYVDLVNRYSSIVSADDKTDPAQIKAMADWNNDVQKALANRDVSKSALKTYVKNMGDLYKKAIDKDEPTKTFMGVEWNKNPDTGIQALKLWSDNSKDYTGTDSKALIYQEYSRIRDERGIDAMPDNDAKAKAITKAVNDVKKSFMSKKNPSLLSYDPENMPNATTQYGQKTLIDPNPSAAKTTSAISPGPKVLGEKDGVQLLQLPDGTIQDSLGVKYIRDAEGRIKARP